MVGVGADIPVDRPGLCPGLPGVPVDCRGFVPMGRLPADRAVPDPGGLALDGVSVAHAEFRAGVGAGCAQVHGHWGGVALSAGRVHR